MKKIILHACCAPCASYPIKKLIEDNYRLVVFFYNPNIYPKEEYLIRKNELENYCKKINIDFFEGAWEPEVYFEKVKGMELLGEKSLRCSACFNLRLEETAKFAIKNNIDSFTTTLSVSPHKNSEQIFKEGRLIAQKYGINFLEYNFKKSDGFKISRQIARENNMYSQIYCGCKFSIR